MEHLAAGAAPWRKAQNLKRKMSDAPCVRGVALRLLEGAATNGEPRQFVKPDMRSMTIYVAASL